MDDATRFWAKVDRRSLFDCWPWTGAKEGLGYGVVRRASGVFKAHRRAYELAVGPIPDGLIVRHICDNPPCCNPSHLAIGTHADNVADKVSRGRQARGEGNGRAVLSIEDVRAIRDRAPSETVAALAREYRVDRRTITYIVQRVNWKHVA